MATAGEGTRRRPRPFPYARARGFSAEPAAEKSASQGPCPVNSIDRRNQPFGQALDHPLVLALLSAVTGGVGAGVSPGVSPFLGVTSSSFWFVTARLKFLIARPRPSPSWGSFVD